MTTFSSLSAFLLAMTLVGAGVVASAEAAPAGKRELHQTKRASAPVAKKPMRIAQAAPAKAATKAERQARRAERFAKIDTNGNGQIDPAERLAMQKLHFAKLDANGDQAISLAEFEAAKKERAQKHAMRADKMGKKGKSHMHRKGKGKRGEGRFARLDTDKNGSVSWQEFSAAKPHKRFRHGHKGQRDGRM